jgi:hypothetical protein
MSGEAVAYDDSDRANPKRSERNERSSFVYDARQGDRGEPSRQRDILQKRVGARWTSAASQQRVYSPHSLTCPYR